MDFHAAMVNEDFMLTGLTSQPSASDMLELEWDEELSWLAQAHADTCKFRHDCNQCRHRGTSDITGDYFPFMDYYSIHQS